MSVMILREENHSQWKILPNILQFVQEFSDFEGNRLSLSFHISSSCALSLFRLTHPTQTITPYQLKLRPVLIQVDTSYTDYYTIRL